MGFMLGLCDEVDEAIEKKLRLVLGGGVLGESASHLCDGRHAVGETVEVVVGVGD